MSAASAIMCVCDERYLYPSTVVMLHEPSAGSAGTASELAIEMETTLTARRYLMDLYSANSRMPFNFWSEILRRDVYLTAEETITLGLADKLVEPKKRGTLRKVRLAALNQSVDKKDLSKLIKSIHKKTHKGNLSHIEIVLPKEEFDASLVVDAVIDDEAVSSP